MKILHIIYSFETGGTENLLVDIINEQINNHKIYICIINDKIDTTLVSKINSNVRIIKINRQPQSKNIYYFIKLNYYIFKIKPSIIHCHNHNIIPLILFRKLYNTVLTLHCIDIPINYLRDYNQLISISKSVKNDVINRGGPDSIVIYNGISLSQFKSLTNAKKAENTSFHIVCIGRLDYKIKGQDILIQAVSIIKKSNPSINIIVDFIGENVYPDDMKYLKELCATLKVEENINFLGLIPRNVIYNSLASYDLLVLPSRKEGFGLTIVEAMIAKVPVLISNNEGPMEVIDYGKYGVYFNNGDCTDCANKINEIITNEKSFNLEESRNYAITNFSLIKTQLKYIELYTKLLK